MNTGTVRKLAVVLALAALGGCSTTSVSDSMPILSAEQIQTMIKVEIRPVEPAPDIDGLVAAAD